MSSIIDNNINLIINNTTNNIIPINNNAFSVGGTVSARLTLTPDYFTFTAESAGELTLNFDSPERFGWDEYILRIRDAFNTEIISAVIINDDKTISATLAKGGRYTISVEAASPQYPLPNADYSITATSFVPKTPLASITAINATLAEGTPKATAKEYTDYQFKISLSEALSTKVKVYYGVINGAGNTLNADDFSSTTSFGSSTFKSFVEFSPGQTEKIVTVQVAKDSIEEPDEQFRVYLYDLPYNLHEHPTQIIAEALITNDDAPVKASISNITTTEFMEGSMTNGGSTYQFKVSLDKPTPTMQTLNYNIVFGTNGADKSDFHPMTPTSRPQKITFGKGASEFIIQLSVMHDLIIENDESFSVQLSNPSSGISLLNASADAVIKNDDAPAKLTMNPFTNSVVEGKAANYTFTTSRPMSSNQTITWSVQGVSGLSDGSLSASDASDFKAQTGTFTIEKGKTTGSFSLNTVDDKLLEGNELFKIALSLPTELELDPTFTEQQTYTQLLDNETPSNATISVASSIMEGALGTTTNLTVTVNLDKAQAIDEILNWRVTLPSADNSDINAAGTDDFVGNQLPTGTVTIAANKKTAQFNIAIQGDGTAEINETFLLSMEAQGKGIKFNSNTTSSSIPIEITNDDGILGTKKADRLVGTNGVDFILGFEGDDTIMGYGGADFIYAGSGNDRIGLGKPQGTAYGGEGNDTIIIDLSSGFELNADVNGDLGTNTLELIGDFLILNTANGILTQEGHVGQVNFRDFTRFKLYSDHANITGNNKNEVFGIETTNATLAGGGGNDVFVLRRFADKSSTLQITDFNQTDKIQINDTGVKKVTPVSNFTGNKGDTVITYGGNTATSVTFDFNGDKIGDFQLILTGLYNYGDLFSKIITIN